MYNLFAYFLLLFYIKNFETLEKIATIYTDHILSYIYTNHILLLTSNCSYATCDEAVAIWIVIFNEILNYIYVTQTFFFKFANWSQLIWDQIKFHLVLNQSEKADNNPNLPWLGKVQKIFFCVYVVVDDLFLRVSEANEVPISSHI